MQWLGIKRHVEQHFYDTSWTLPSTSFLNWISGLRPYLQQRTLREEVKDVLDNLIALKKIKLKGKPLNKKQSGYVRQGLAINLGLGKKALKAQKDEIDSCNVRSWSSSTNSSWRTR